MPSEAVDFLVRPYQPGDEGAILPSFNRVFAAIDPTFTPRSANSRTNSPASWPTSPSNTSATCSPTRPGYGRDDTLAASSEVAAAV